MTETVCNNKSYYIPNQSQLVTVSCVDMEMLVSLLGVLTVVTISLIDKSNLKIILSHPLIATIFESRLYRR